MWIFHKLAFDMVLALNLALGEGWYYLSCKLAWKVYPLFLIDEW